MDAATMNTLTTIIGTVGFPIVACGACFWYMIRQSKSHKEEVDKLSQALQNNTVVMQQLVDYLKGGAGK